MTGAGHTVRVTDTEGHTVHIGPHDIYCHDPDSPPMHKDTADADVYVDKVITVGSIAVLMAHAGTTRWAVAYDRDDRVRCVA